MQLNAGYTNQIICHGLKGHSNIALYLIAHFDSQLKILLLLLHTSMTFFMATLAIFQYETIFKFNKACCSTVSQNGL